MLKILSSLVDLLLSAINLFISLIDSLISLFGLVFSSVTGLLTYLGYIPTFILSFATGAIVILLIKMCLNVFKGGNNA